MRKSLALLTLTSTFLLNYSCGLKDDIEDTLDGLQCVDLIAEIDEKWDSEDRNCSEIESDVDSILNTCEDFLDEEQIEQLEFYKANCDAANQ